MKILKFDDASRVFFTSDTHFGHKNILEFCNRPFSSVEEMNEKLIENWNSVVGKNDYVFHLGDFAFGGSQLWNSVLDRLNGNIFLILGNHEMKNLHQGYMTKFKWVGYQLILNIGGRTVYLNHYPFLYFGGAYRSEENAVIQLFGHCHSRPHEDISDLTDEEVKEILGKDSYRLQYLFPTQYDVGVDNNNFTPVSWVQLKEIITKQQEEYESRGQNSPSKS